MDEAACRKAMKEFFLNIDHFDQLTEEQVRAGLKHLLSARQIDQVIAKLPLSVRPTEIFFKEFDEHLPLRVIWDDTLVRPKLEKSFSWILRLPLKMKWEEVEN
jgi:hypothetical protein